MNESYLTKNLLNGMLNPEDMATLIEEVMKSYKKKEYLEHHKYKLYQGKDGRWFTRLPLVSGGSKQVAYKTLEEAEEKIAEFYEEWIEVRGILSSPRMRTAAFVLIQKRPRCLFSLIYLE